MSGSERIRTARSIISTAEDAYSAAPDETGWPALKLSLEAGITSAFLKRDTEIERLRAALMKIANQDFDDDIKNDARVLAGFAWSVLPDDNQQSTLYECRHCGAALKKHKPNCPTLRSA